MFCKNCGADLHTGAKYCSKCGTKVDDQDTVFASMDMNSGKTDVVVGSVSRTDVSSAMGFMIAGLVLSLCSVFVPYLNLLTAIPSWIITFIAMSKVINVFSSVGESEYEIAASKVKTFRGWYIVDLIALLPALIAMFIFILWLAVYLEYGKQEISESVGFTSTAFLSVYCIFSLGLKIWGLVLWIKTQDKLSNLDRRMSNKSN